MGKFTPEIEEQSKHWKKNNKINIFICVAFVRWGTFGATLVR